MPGIIGNSFEEGPSILGAAYGNPLLFRQISNQRAANPRPNVTDVFGYGPSWQTYGQNFASNAGEHLPASGDSPEQWVSKMIGILGLGGLTAFHGSPHKFDKFDMSKVGAGEGAQAYGHGLYFAENPEVAKSYTKTGK